MRSRLGSHAVQDAGSSIHLGEKNYLDEFFLIAQLKTLKCHLYYYVDSELIKSSHKLQYMYLKKIYPHRRLNV